MAVENQLGLSSDWQRSGRVDGTGGVGGRVWEERKGNRMLAMGML
jgi:hypothetical protein